MILEILQPAHFCGGCVSSLGVQQSYEEPMEVLSCHQKISCLSQQVQCFLWIAHALNCTSSNCRLRSVGHTVSCFQPIFWSKHKHARTGITRSLVTSSGPDTTGVNNLEFIAFVFKIENVHWSGVVPCFTDNLRYALYNFIPITLLMLLTTLWNLCELFRTRKGRKMQFGQQGHRNDEIQWSEKLWQIACSLQWYKPILGYVESSWHFASCHSVVCLTPAYSASPPDLQGMFYIHSVWIVVGWCCWRCLLDQEVQEVCAKHPVFAQVPYIFIRHRKSNLKARITWKVLSFLLVLSSYSRWQRRIADGSDGSLAPCCHYTIYKFWLLIMQECDTCTWITIFWAMLYTQGHVQIWIFLIEDTSVIQHT